MLELLVAISILGLLASIILVSLQSAKKSAEDAKMIIEIGQLKVAMFSYFYDKKDFPPVSGSNGFASSLVVQNSLQSGYYLTSLLEINNFFYVHRCDANTPCTLSGQVNNDALFTAGCPGDSSVVAMVWFWTNNLLSGYNHYGTNFNILCLK